MRPSDIWRALREIICPTYCIACGARLNDTKLGVCSDCFDRLPRAEGLEQYYGGADRLAGHVPLAEVHYDLLFSEVSVTRLLIHDIKYNGLPQQATELVRHFAQRHLEAGHYQDVSCIVPVPIAPNRLKKRGYNQCSFIAKGLSEVYQIPVVEEALLRRNSGTQTNRKKESRWRALEGAFYGNAGVLEGRRVLLVDDLLTSGATLVHAARTLYQECGVESVSIYTLAIDLLSSQR